MRALSDPSNGWYARSLLYLSYSSSPSSPFSLSSSPPSVSIPIGICTSCRAKLTLLPLDAPLSSLPPPLSSAVGETGSSANMGGICPIGTIKGASLSLILSLQASRALAFTFSPIMWRSISAIFDWKEEEGRKKTTLLSVTSSCSKEGGTKGGV